MGANSRYTVAIHILLLLQEPGAELVTSDWIAGSVNTNPVVIRRLLCTLIEAGLVDAHKGAHGGYRLARPGKNITLWEVYEVMREDGLFGLHCATPNAKCPVGASIQTHLGRIYDQAEQSMRVVLSRTTIGDLRRSVMHG